MVEYLETINMHAYTFTHTHFAFKALAVLIVACVSVLWYVHSRRITSSSLPAQWAHATNTRDLIDIALADELIIFVEADVAYGTWQETGTSKAEMEEKVTDESQRKDLVMCHPPMYVSNLRLVDLVAFVVGCERVRVLKLDFKDPNAVEPSMKVLKKNDKLDVATNLELWLNADILTGPGGTDALFSPDDFIDQTLEFPGAVLSLGWTTGVTSPRDLGYTTQMVTDMLTLCGRSELKGLHITFPVHGVHALNSEKDMLRLLDADPLYTITFWGEADMHVVDWIENTFPPDRVYVDLQTYKKQTTPVALTLLRWLNIVK
ncbi:hypothetical protein SARC_06207 [Sphaeroforma arctica JP610]|uniref:Menorin-like domain-containing protein n=1 Tax=Sphaeroforma arctica JP610 TaxID=667725 RepID=A0A0L0FXW5_9EUKA|nr:hypothetical protein SARC_06207 [Sphaeroforma arctica JP610]KNC81479.1 hypothetical protein SARC_06207 [Sphaeroforma arctica JP610]|eukprot:XP_014155381.1 hypothetical protein SARC_06207 [Sphaeroforma arctica JP610]